MFRIDETGLPTFDVARQHRGADGRADRGIRQILASAVVAACACATCARAFATRAWLTASCDCAARLRFSATSTALFASSSADCE